MMWRCHACRGRCGPSFLFTLKSSMLIWRVAVIKIPSHWRHKENGNWPEVAQNQLPFQLHFLIFLSLAHCFALFARSCIFVSLVCRVNCEYVRSSSPQGGWSRNGWKRTQLAILDGKERFKFWIIFGFWIIFWPHTKVLYIGIKCKSSSRCTRHFILVNALHFLPTSISLR